MINLRVVTDYDPPDGNTVNNYLYSLLTSGGITGSCVDITNYPTIDLPALNPNSVIIDVFTDAAGAAVIEADPRCYVLWSVENA